MYYHVTYLRLTFGRTRRKYRYSRTVSRVGLWGVVMDKLGRKSSSQRVDWVCNFPMLGAFTFDDDGWSLDLGGELILEA
jgi:hypothetical protein